MALNTRMWENFCNYRFLSRKRYEIVNHQQKVIDSQSIGVGSNDLKWPWKVSNEGHNFLAGLHNYARAVWPRMTEFGVITQTGGEKHICKGVSHLPIPRWRAPTFTKFLRPLPTPKRFVLERPNLVRQHMRSRSVFLGGQPRTPPRELASPIFFVNCGLPHARTEYEKQQRNFALVIKLDVRKKISRSTTNADARSVYGCWRFCFDTVAGDTRKEQQSFERSR